MQKPLRSFRHPCVGALAVALGVAVSGSSALAQTSGGNILRT